MSYRTHLCNNKYVGGHSIVYDTQPVQCHAHDTAPRPVPTSHPTEDKRLS